MKRRVGICKTQKQAAATNYIRQWRMFRGVKSQGDLAALTIAADPAGAGVHRVTINRLETGMMRYNQEQLELIGKALKASPAELIGTNPMKRSRG